MVGDDEVRGSTSARNVHEILGLLHGNDIETWVAGGWGVDALLGKQTRDHRDLDVLIPYERTIAAFEALRQQHFRLTTDWFPVRFEMIHGSGGIVDVHPIRRLDDGGAELAQIDGPPWIYTPDALAGEGVIDGVAVRCLSAAEQVRTHLGYEPTLTDIQDMGHLAERFGLDLPAPYHIMGSRT